MSQRSRADDSARVQELGAFSPVAVWRWWSDVTCGPSKGLRWKGGARPPAVAVSHAAYPPWKFNKGERHPTPGEREHVPQQARPALQPIFQATSRKPLS